MSLVLKPLKPFAQGGNRLCYVHPDFADRCIKVRRPDFTLEDRRRKKGFPKNLKPLSSFDDNLEEFRVMQQFQQDYDEGLFDHISRCYGFEDSDMGKGLTSELIRDSDGRISITLKQYLWDFGYPSALQMAVADLCRHWRHYRVPSRDLLVHNVVVQREWQGEQEIIRRLVVIDGLGSADIIPLAWQPERWRKNKTERKLINFHQRIEDMLATRGGETFPGYHGLLFHDGLAEQGGERPND